MRSMWFIASFWWDLVRAARITILRIDLYGKQIKECDTILNVCSHINATLTARQTICDTLTVLQLQISSCK